MEQIQCHLELQSMNCFFDLESEESRHGQHLSVRSWKILVIVLSSLSPFETVQPVLCVKILEIAIRFPRV